MGGKIPRGFTIVEVLIVLSITGALVAAAISLVSGKQGTTEFSVGVRQIVSQLKGDVDQVQNGQYSVAGRIKCVPVKAYNTIKITINNSVNKDLTTGTSFGCQYIGKVFQFTQNGYNIYPVASNSNYYSSSTSPPSQITNINQINPCAVLGSPSLETGSCSLYNSVNNYSVNFRQLPNNITFTTNSDTNNPYLSMFAYYNIFSTGALQSCDIAISNNLSSSLGIDLIPFNQSALTGLTTVNILSAINQPLINSSCNQPGSASNNSYLTDSMNANTYLCLKSGTSDQYAKIELANGSPTSVDLIDIQSTLC